MGQFGNQPDFATNSIQQLNTITNTINQSTFLDSSIIYIGDNTTAGDVLVVIPAGTAGPTTVTALVSPGYAGHGGTGYGNGVNLQSDVSGGSGQDMQIEYTAVNGVVTEVTLIDDAGSNYLSGDIVTLIAGNGNATFRVIATIGPPTAAQSVAFHGLQAGGFLPVTVDYVLASNGTDTTSVQKLIAAK
jgi:hypothetical protein